MHGQRQCVSGLELLYIPVAFTLCVLHSFCNELRCQIRQDKTSNWLLGLLILSSYYVEIKIRELHSEVRRVRCDLISCGSPCISLGCNSVVTRGVTDCDRHLKLQSRSFEMPHLNSLNICCKACGPHGDPCHQRPALNS